MNSRINTKNRIAVRERLNSQKRFKSRMAHYGRADSVEVNLCKKYVSNSEFRDFDHYRNQIGQFFFVNHSEGRRTILIIFL